jgi:hypothetical protein
LELGENRTRIELDIARLRRVGRETPDEAIRRIVASLNRVSTKESVLTNLQSESVADFSSLLTLLREFVDSRRGLPIHEGEEWLADSQTLAVKFFRHLYSMRALCELPSLTIDETGPPIFVDHSSIMVLARAAYEAYLVYCYIFGERDIALAKFRHKTWHLGGLLDRQKSTPTSRVYAAQIARERAAAEALKNEIRRSPHFSTFTENQRTELLKGNWRVVTSWPKLAVAAGFHKLYFTTIYNLLCGYGHSSYISVLQIAGASERAEQVKLAGIALKFCNVLTAHFIYAFAQNIPPETDIPKADEAAAQLVHRWRFAATEFEKHYVTESTKISQDWA